MKLLDMDKLAQGIIHPFTEILKTFTAQMEQLHGEVRDTNRLLEEILKEVRREEV